MSVAEIITAAVAACGTVGGAVAFVWNKIENRFTEIEGKLEECQTRERDSLDRRSVQLTVIELLWQEVKRLAPDAVVLIRAKRLLDDLKVQNDEDVARHD